MRKLVHFIFLITIILSTFSCTTHFGSMQGSRCTGKCFYNSIAVGTAEKSQFLGIGGNETDAMLFEAKRNLYRAFPLRKDEFYDNFATDFKSTNYILFSKTLVTVTADVVSETGDDTDGAFTENYKHSLSAGKATHIDGIHLSDSIVYVKGSYLARGIVIDFVNGKAKVIVSSKKGTQIIETVAIQKLFTVGNEEIEDLTDLEAGQVIEYSSNSSQKGGTIIKTIEGLKADKVLISININGSLTYSVVPVGKVKQ